MTGETLTDRSRVDPVPNILPRKADVLARTEDLLDCDCMVDVNVIHRLPCPTRLTLLSFIDPNERGLVRTQSGLRTPAAASR